MLSLKGNLNSLRIDEPSAGGLAAKSVQARRPFPAGRIQCEPFIRSMPLRWIQKAARLPGKALAVGIAARYAAGLKKSPYIKLPSTLLRDFGINRFSDYRALRLLEMAGLLKVRRHRGRCPEVEIVDQESDSPKSNQCE